jgi:hypothetical protein
MQCPHCDQEHSETAQYCPLTGKEIIKQQICPGCGNPVDANWQHCGFCGRKLIKTEGKSNQQEANSPQSSQATSTMQELLTTTNTAKPIAQEEQHNPGAFEEYVINNSTHVANGKRSPDNHLAVVKQSEKRGIEFTGTGFQALGWGMYFSLLGIFIIPAAWGAVAMYRWIIQNLKFSDGAKASFEGQGGQVWGYYALLWLLAFVPQIPRFVVADDQETLPYIQYGLALLIMPISAFIVLKLMRWFFSNIKLSDGTIIDFNGDYGTYLGWGLLVTISTYTIIGWAWATVAMIRWFCRHIDAGKNQLEFLGSGWGLLWRFFLAGLASIFIIPIPWVSLWVFRWIIGNILITKISDPYHDEKL